ncbi:TetR/AcrR family transcriptional regulator [Paenibacillus sp. SYP-B3998]|uniref:TetR/AcrR family transcriptional regulator n=1 Tax=Paenibacillus sp. SYP-B3998 TaxID=2678564 RepID=A0A6G3ZTF5_9BACL|nr:TetR/AcrR family transcriptional regulator [Paenibacillus sp. SYP-B3998]NEW05483.1 TetR/AcrR family transcriptional regulator [Paenibacillus sp. SYP-B3998]
MRQSKRQIILEAATKFVLSQGAAQLTLDAVAKEAEISKGGLFYHFATKEILIKAMVVQAREHMTDSIQKFYDQDNEPKGRWTRAYLRWAQEDLERNKELYSALLIAMVTNPGLLNPVELFFQQLYEKVEVDQLDPVLANVICLAADGLWYADMFNFNPLREEMRTKVIGRLIELTKEGTR